MRLTEERRQEGRRRKEEGTFCKLEICTLRLAKATATEWKENGEGLTQTDANEAEEIVINEGKQLHEITDAIAPLLAADAHPHIPHSLTACPTPAATPIAGSTCLGPQRHQRPSALSVDCFFAHPARVPCSNCKVSSLPSAHFCPGILDSAFVTSLCSLYSVCLWGVVSK